MHAESQCLLWHLAFHGFLAAFKGWPCLSSDNGRLHESVYEPMALPHPFGHNLDQINDEVSKKLRNRSKGRIWYVSKSGALILLVHSGSHSRQFREGYAEKRERETSKQTNPYMAACIQPLIPVVSGFRPASRSANHFLSSYSGTLTQYGPNILANLIRKVKLVAIQTQGAKHILEKDL